MAYIYQVAEERMSWIIHWFGQQDTAENHSRHKFFCWESLAVKVFTEHIGL